MSQTEVRPPSKLWLIVATTLFMGSLLLTGVVQLMYSAASGSTLLSYPSDLPEPQLWWALTIGLFLYLLSQVYSYVRDTRQYRRASAS